MQFDSENKNSKWYHAIKLVMESMLEYKVFQKWDKAILDKHRKVTNPPRGYHRIRIHQYLLPSLMTDIKLDWWQMAT